MLLLDLFNVACCRTWGSRGGETAELSSPRLVGISLESPSEGLLKCAERMNSWKGSRRMERIKRGRFGNKKNYFIF